MPKKTIEQQILELAKTQMDYMYKFDNASQIDEPIGKVTLANGIQAQVILKVITEPADFLHCTTYSKHS